MNLLNGWSINLVVLSNERVRVRYIGPRKDYYDGDFYCFGFWWFHVYLTDNMNEWIHNEKD